MKFMTGDDIRREFISFFEKKGHLALPSASLIPENDPSLLLIGAGMAPFKAYFTGTATPPSSRVVTAQKCVRTPDIERVGKTARHATCFEMLGNFSFGDYFKKDAIHWAWEFLTEVVELDPERLHITVHKDDQEAYDIWFQEVGVPKERIYLGDEDNFWEIGTGPCGPCSEIYYDQGPAFACSKPDCQMGCDCDRFLEIWNLVFTQYTKDDDGVYHPLSRKCIDTGLGLDRLAAITQNKPSIFEIDLIQPMLDILIKKSGIKYDGRSPESLAARVIVDHIKGVVFLIADGVLPGNEGRGYVLRRLLRRAIRYGRLLGMTGIFTPEIAKGSIQAFQVGYPDLKEKEQFILQVLSLEEGRFNETLEAGLTLVKQFLGQMKERKQKVLEGIVAFKLHDTFGFPLELTREIVEEAGFDLDLKGFQEEMQKQRARARAARSQVDAMGSHRIDVSSLDSSFSGYTSIKDESIIDAIYLDGHSVEEAPAGKEVKIVLSSSPFYGESGGQVGDTGFLIKEGMKHPVTDTESQDGVQILHVTTEGVLKVGDPVTAQVDEMRRLDIARHHSATHLLHKALRQVLGEHVHQAGSWVGPERLRFDFSHFNAISPEELSQIECLVRGWILDNNEVKTEQMTLDEAKAQDVTALFGEKYADWVRVIRMGSSSELCGGTHVRATGDIGPFVIASESGIGSGLRRIEALAGRKAYAYFKAKEDLIAETASLLKSKEDDILRRINGLQIQLKDQERRLASMSAQNTLNRLDEFLQNKKEISGVDTLVMVVEAEKPDDLRDLADHLRDKMGSGIVVLAAAIDGKASLLAAATKDLKDKFHAGNLIKEAAKLVGGGGGGRPDLAQAGGKNPENIEKALPQIFDLINKQLADKDKA